MKNSRFLALVWLSSVLLLCGHIFGEPGTVNACAQPTACLETHDSSAAIAFSRSSQTPLSDQTTAATQSQSSPSLPAANTSPRDRRVPTPQASTDDNLRLPILGSFDSLEQRSVIVLGLVASLLAGLATGVGAIPVLFVRKISDRLQGALLGFAAGVMLAATSFSLLIPSIERVSSTGGSGVEAAAVAVGGTLLGSGFIWVTDLTLPYQRLLGEPNGRRNYTRLKGIWLFIIAIAIHNFPEGLAVGVGFGGDNIGNGVALAIGIGLQNIPEGLAVALALVTQHYTKWTAFGVAVATGLVEPVGGLFGVGIISLGTALLPWGLAFAAGAMLFVIGDEVIPEAQSLASGKLATAAIVGGFVIMMFLDVALG